MIMEPTKGPWPIDFKRLWLEKLRLFQAAAHNLDDAWTIDITGVESYPFEAGFSEIINDIDNWLEKQDEIISKSDHVWMEDRKS